MGLEEKFEKEINKKFDIKILTTFFFLICLGLYQYISGNEIPILKNKLIGLVPIFVVLEIFINDGHIRFRYILIYIFCIFSIVLLYIFALIYLKFIILFNYNILIVYEIIKALFLSWVFQLFKIKSYKYYLSKRSNDDNGK
ncbi:hypothetical protein [Fusobacterium sp. PH5-44]|uniref:hypothetical protein n=1 Tax=unclassified Fusobacterium TaxID=2648384 RepID=UPI003D19F0E6